MAKKANPTLKQIAELTGFSQASVSMILSERPDVSFSEETVRAVLAAAESIGYERRGEGRRGRKAPGGRLVAVLCPNISNPYYATLVQSIEQAAGERDFGVLVLNTYRSPEREARSLETLRRSGAAGLVFAMPPQSPRLLEEAAGLLPAVVIGDKGGGLGLDAVEMDNYGAGALVARHLAELGHRRIAYVSTTLSPGNSVRLRRLAGLEETFRALLPEGRVLVSSREVSPAEELADLEIEHRVGFELAREALGDPEVTAIAAVNDMVAYGVIDAIRAAALSVPEDYSVTGFDNVFPSRLSPLSLTTVDNYIVDKGRRAFAMLHARMAGAPPEGADPRVITRVEYPPRLVVRGSTAPARRGRPGEGRGAAAPGAGGPS